jgi:hypothetical protein
MQLAGVAPDGLLGHLPVVGDVADDHNREKK